MGTGEINTVPTESNEKIEIKCKDVNEIMPRDKEKSIISNLRELANNKPTKRDSKTPEICNRIVKDETDYRHRDIEKERRERKRHESNRRNLNRERDYRYYERKHRERGKEDLRDFIKSRERSPRRNFPKESNYHVSKKMERDESRVHWRYKSNNFDTYSRNGRYLNNWVSTNIRA